MRKINAHKKSAAAWFPEVTAQVTKGIFSHMTETMFVQDVTGLHVSSLE